VTSRTIVCVFTGSRADYGRLLPLIRRLRHDPRFQLQVLVSGTHLAGDHGLTIKELEQDGVHVDERVEMVLAHDSATSVIKSLGLGIIGYADALDRLDPDVLVVLGDRYEALGVATAAAIRLIPLAHVAGGQVTEGALDERFRHAMTKLASLHFTSTAECRRRVLQLGEIETRVHAVGALGLDMALNEDVIERAELIATLGLDPSPLTLLVTYHPATADPRGSDAGMRGLFVALHAIRDATVIFTAANADAGGRTITAHAHDFVDQHADRMRLYTSLGQRWYLSLLRHADAVVGNSSSGLVEAPSLQTATVNIGSRQAKRLRARSVIDCGETAEEIEAAIRRAVTPEFQEICRSTTSPYGDGHAANRIAEILARTELQDLIRKPFVDRTGTTLDGGEHDETSGAANHGDSTGEDIVRQP
jgi:UDP-hydrolysing UDP-N-acetyl-D-glucosamine 2-epimerase